MNNFRSRITSAGLAVCISFIGIAAQASVFHFGAAGGANYSSGRIAVGPPAWTSSLSGWSYSASTTLTFFQDYIPGFQLGGDLLNLNLSGAATAPLARALIASFIPRLSFDFLGARHSIGLGLGYVIPGNAAWEFQPSAGTLAFALDGKDMWAVGSHYFFVNSRVFIFTPSGMTSVVAISLLLGFDL